MLRIAYYINQQGSGHLNRAICFKKELDKLGLIYKLYLFTNKHCDFGITIPVPTIIYSGKARGCFEDCWTNMSEVVSPIVSACIKHKFDIFVSDLSTEITTLVRPFVGKLVHIMLHGKRTDCPHINAIELADQIICPYHKDAGDSFTDQFHYSGGFIKQQYDTNKSEIVSETFKVLVLLGTGGTSYCKDYISDSSNVLVLGDKLKVVNPLAYIEKADVVVGNAGNSIVHEVSYYNKPFICIPESRPYDEQIIKADLLAKKNYALVSSWNSTLENDLKSLVKQSNKSHLVEPSAAYYYTKLILS